MKNKFAGEILHLVSDPKGHFLLLVILLGQTTTVLLNVYGYNSSKENTTLIDVISDNMQYWINEYPSPSIILGGDFNMVLNSDLDRFPSRTYCVSPIMDAFMTRFNVVDIWRVTYPQQRLYTWSSKDHSKQS